MPRKSRTRHVDARQVESYLDKAEEFLAAAVDAVDGNRPVAAPSLAIHAGINAGDVITGARTGSRAAGQDHDQVLHLLNQAGDDGKSVAKNAIIGASVAATAAARAQRAITATSTAKATGSSSIHGRGLSVSKGTSATVSPIETALSTALTSQPWPATIAAACDSNVS